MFLPHGQPSDSSIQRPLAGVMARTAARQGLVGQLPKQNGRLRVKWICKQGKIPATEQTKAQRSIFAPCKCHLRIQGIHMEKGNIHMLQCFNFNSKYMEKKKKQLY